MVCYMYEEDGQYYVVYGDADSLWGPSERNFGSDKQAAEEFMAEYRKEI